MIFFYRSDPQLPRHQFNRKSNGEVDKRCNLMKFKKIRYEIDEIETSWPISIRHLNLKEVKRRLSFKLLINVRA